MVISPAGEAEVRRQDRLRIALFLDHAPDTGGGFYLSLAVIESFLRSRVTKHEFVVFTRFEQTQRRLLQCGVKSILFRHRGVRLIDRWSATVVGGAILRRLRRFVSPRLGRHLDALLDDHGVDLVFFPEIGDAALRIGDHPFISMVWDLDQLDHPDFPEFYRERVFERVEARLRRMLPRAMTVIANTHSLARQIARAYQVEPTRIMVLPFPIPLNARRHATGKASNTSEQVHRKYDLPERYVFYPAYFSIHKNHLYLLEALLALERQHGHAVHAIFCGGGEPGDQEKVERQVEALQLKNRVRFLGLVPDEDILALYEGALALVMPSYFGPTNLPPLEAAALGCPAICSDLPGCREQMGEAALYCDLADPEDLAHQLANLIEHPELRARLQAAGRHLAAEISKIDYAEALAPVLDEYAYVCRRWKWPERNEGAGC